ncbi:uncharacterized protein NFIA_032810 [Aspergillus fischeri NRRL 181]|uniref:Uncharacterized protein n=1 Tax=Neosartorya fischeri (strain ATCC 1020 / DSM 3700 / CBS 544.65 / FGSC A1164 / JCM 1740 / NRRL 181 / WB 181) TaxID=331117 RepID=A1CY96_NEOFI|nr:uncharacterized protein NFIA_032810 [Aspergillus fischeri NRRL 181]EAW23716.1 hypothetical protein NFIA_032810 [Aspergillus fischeri NRRL 181]
MQENNQSSKATSTASTTVQNRKPDSEDPIYEAKERYKNALNSLINLIAQGDNDSIDKLLEFLRKQETIHEAVQEVLQLKFLPE